MCGQRDGRMFIEDAPKLMRLIWNKAETRKSEAPKLDPTRLKPFDLQRALDGYPVVNGVGVRIIELAHLKSMRRIFYCTEGRGINDASEWCDESGCIPGTGTQILFMVPKTRTVYVNLFPNPHGPIGGGEARWHTTQGNADRDYFESRLGNCAFPITIE